MCVVCIVCVFGVCVCVWCVNMYGVEGEKEHGKSGLSNQTVREKTRLRNLN